MLLPQHILQQVKWFEYYGEKGDDWFDAPIDRFVLHFAPWWKLSKTIRIERDYSRETANTIFYKESISAKELLAQLKTHCGQ